MPDDLQRYLQQGLAEPGGRSGALISRLLTATSILVAILSLVGTKDIPLWLTVIFGAFVAVITVVVAKPVIGMGLSTLKSSVRARRGTRALLPRVQRDYERLQRQLSSDATNTLLYEMREFVSCRTTTGEPLFHDIYSTPQHIAEWLHLVAVSRTPTTKAILLYFSAMNLAMNQYSQFCKVLNNRLQSYMQQDQIAPDTTLKIKLAWNNGRESQVRLIHDWADTAHEINRTIGRDVCQAFNEPVRAWP